MLLKQLKIRNFRNYEESTVSLCTGINEFFGDNAQGKTSLLEAVYFLSLGRSFRSPRLQDLIRHDADVMCLEAVFNSGGVDQTLRIASDGKTRKVVHNDTTYPSLSSLIGLLPVVLMAPDDELIKGPPQVRRNFLDLQISQADPKYLLQLSRYQRAMKQRNQLLRTQNFSTIASWEAEMAVAASYITQKRLEVSDQLQPLYQRLYPKLSGEDISVSLAYHCRLPKNCDFIQGFKEQFEKDRDREAQLGVTLAGPHRDDLMIYIGEKDTRFFASEGQKRSCLAALRFSTWHLLKTQLGFPPLMLIDDLGAHLDEKRRSHLMYALEAFPQVFTTSVERHPAGGSKHSYNIIGGRVYGC